MQGEKEPQKKSSRNENPNLLHKGPIDSKYVKSDEAARNSIQAAEKSDVIHNLLK